MNLKNSMLIVAVIVVFSVAVGADEKLNVLVVTGGHGYEQEPFEAMFNSFGGLNCTFVALQDHSEIFEDISDWQYDVLVLYNMSQKISEKRQQNFLKLLDDGVGLVVLHHAIAAFSDWREYRKIIGAKYWLEDLFSKSNLSLIECAIPGCRGTNIINVRFEKYLKYLRERA